MDELDCKGNETSMLKCKFNPWTVTDCDDNEWVGVSCKQNEILECDPVVVRNIFIFIMLKTYWHHRWRNVLITFKTTLIMK